VENFNLAFYICQGLLVRTEFRQAFPITPGFQETSQGLLTCMFLGIVKIS